MEPWIKEYMELILSKEGQDNLSDLTKTDGFLPLNSADVARERAKLD
jgi:hypothetical protein